MSRPSTGPGWAGGVQYGKALGPAVGEDEPQSQLSRRGPTPALLMVTSALGKTSPPNVSAPRSCQAPPRGPPVRWFVARQPPGAGVPRSLEPPKAGHKGQASRQSHGLGCVCTSGNSAQKTFPRRVEGQPGGVPCRGQRSGRPGLRRTGVGLAQGDCSCPHRPRTGRPPRRARQARHRCGRGRRLPPAPPCVQ